MTWRMKLADWISGGELSRAVMEVVDLQKEVDDCFWYEEALIHIVHMETPRCANIGKRMAAVAREALE